MKPVVFALSLLLSLVVSAPLAAADCTSALSSSNASFDARGGAGAVDVFIASGCAWTAVSQEGWITVTDGASSVGSGTVAFTVDPNPWEQARTGVILIAGQELTVSEAAYGQPPFEMSPAQPDIGETVLFTVSGVTPVSWDMGDADCFGHSQSIDCTTLPDGACNVISWTYPSSGSKTVTVRATTANMGRTFFVEERGACCTADAAPSASFTIAPNPAVVGEEVTFTDTSGLPKTAVLTGDFSWNPSTPEIGELTTFDVTGLIGVDAARWDFGEDGCPGFPRVATCEAISTDCLAISHRFASAGEQQVTLTATLGGTTIPVATRTVTVLSSGSCAGGCSYALSPSAASFPDAGGAGSVAVTSEDGCQWTASSPVAWVTITSAGAGSGPGAVTYQVAPNSGGYRTTTLLVGNQEHTVTQAAAGSGTCTYSLSSSAASFPAAGGPGSFVVTTGDHCVWTVDVDRSWVTVTSGSTGIGAGTVAYQVADNAGAARSATITAAGLAHVVSQAEPVEDPLDTAPTAWSWTVELAGTTVAASDQASFSHTFAEPGPYTVRLLAANCQGEDDAVAELQVDPLPVVTPAAWLVPAAIHAPGLADTVWKTDLRLFNPGDQAVAATIEFLPENVNNSNAALAGLDLTLAPGTTVAYDDILAAIPGIAALPAKGALLLHFDDGAGNPPLVTPVITSRTYNDTAAGTFGQFVPAVAVLPEGDAASFLSGLAENDAFRTNIGLANLGEVDAGIEVVLLDQSGTEVGRVPVTVPGLSTAMVVQVARRAGLSAPVDAFAVRVDADGTAISAYASVVDNLTGDPVLYTGYPVGGDPLLVPGFAHLPGVNDSVWRSDASFANPSGAAISFMAEYVPAASSSTPPDPLLLTLAPWASTVVADLVGAVLGDEVASSGYLVVAGNDGSPTPQVVVRTYSLDPVAGGFGQSLKAFRPDELIGEGETASIAGVSDSLDPELGFRTNLGLLNADPAAWAAVAIVVSGEDGTTVAAVDDLYLAPGELKQFNLFTELGVADGAALASVSITVLDNGPVAAYASVVDNRTQDPILIPALPVR